MFRIEVYDKSDHPVTKPSRILLVVALVLFGISFLFDDDQSQQVKDIVFYIAFPLLIIIGIMRIIDKAHHLGPMGELSYLTVNEDSISFFNTKIYMSQVDRIVVRLRDKEVINQYTANNYLEITTQYGEKYKLAILIANDKGLNQVDKMISHLRKKIKNVSYENYL